jgi:hypothetical protein
MFDNQLCKSLKMRRRSPEMSEANSEPAVLLPLNVSLTVAKKDGKWLIAAMHFSTLTGAATAEANSEPCEDEATI